MNTSHTPPTLAPSLISASGQYPLRPHQPSSLRTMAIKRKYEVEADDAFPVRVPLIHIV